MKSINTFLTISLIITFALNACTSTEQPGNTAAQASPTISVQQPFRFHKAIEVKPGLTLDILSWGRGSESVGAYLILRSDSTHLKYRSLTGELDGKIIDVWNMDMDSDGNPELFIQAQGEGEGSHLNMYVYEFTENGSAQKLNFPNLGSSSKKGYKGNDSIYIKDSKLRREFPIVPAEGSEKTAEQKKILEYDLRNNSFTVKEIEAEEKAN